MSVKKIIFCSLLFAFVCTPAPASITEQGTGMLFGDDHAFFITAPKGWVLDNQTGVQQGIHMAFYPEGYTWSNSPEAYNAKRKDLEFAYWDKGTTTNNIREK